MMTLDRARGQTPTQLLAAAIAAVEELNAEAPRPEVLRAFPGWGRLPKLFTDDEGTAALREARVKLLGLLTDMDQATARGSTLNMMFTPDYLISLMWRAVFALGFTGGAVLDMGCGIGQFAELMPDVLRDRVQYVGVEKDATACAIARHLHPEASIYRADALKWSHPKGRFNLVIGNIPFEDGGMAGYGDFKPKVALHARLFLRAIEMLAPGGLLCLITTTGTLDSRGRSGEYLAFRQVLAGTGAFLGALRLPGDAFSSTGKSSDLILWQKPGDSMYTPRSPDIVESVPSLLLDPKSNPIYVNEYFLSHPHRLVGETYPDSASFGTDFGTRWPGGFGQDLAIAIETALMQLVADASFAVQAQTVHFLNDSIGESNMIAFKVPLSVPTAQAAPEEPEIAPVSTVAESDRWKNFTVDFYRKRANCEIFFGEGVEFIPPQAVRDEMGLMGFRFYRPGSYWYGPVNSLSFPWLEQLSINNGNPLEERVKNKIQYMTAFNVYGGKAAVEDDFTPDNAADYDGEDPMQDFHTEPSGDFGADLISQIMSGQFDVAKMADDFIAAMERPPSMFSAEYLAELKAIRAMRVPSSLRFYFWLQIGLNVWMPSLAAMIEMTMLQMPAPQSLAEVPPPPTPIPADEPVATIEPEDAPAPKRQQRSVD